MERKLLIDVLKDAREMVTLEDHRGAFYIDGQWWVTTWPLLGGPTETEEALPSIQIRPARTDWSNGRAPETFQIRYIREKNALRSAPETSPKTVVSTGWPDIKGYYGNIPEFLEGPGKADPWPLRPNWGDKLPVLGEIQHPPGGDLYYLTQKTYRDDCGTETFWIHSRSCEH